ncbi:unnamed protein product [Malus baccata var. baccata]
MPRRAKTSLDHQKPLVMAMKLDSLLLAVLFIIGIALTNAKKSPVIPSRYNNTSLNRTSFPKGFIFGSASAAYQYEGAWNQGGRKPSIWDNYTHQYPERINGSTTGDVAADQYHRYKEDVGIMKNMGLDAYRLSISWSRVLPNGKLSGGVNQEGIKYYNNLINALLSRGYTAAHNHFRDFAEICYKAFGDRVKHWMTLNEPWTYAVNGYAEGAFAPGRCSAWMERNCTGGDSGTEPYLVAHNFLLAHAAAVKLYRYKYQKIQRGVIGMALGVHWFMEPLTSGSYPHTMKVLVGKRLPVFTAEQSKLIKGSYDFIGINYYTTHYSSYAPHNNSLNASYLTDARVFQSPLHNGVPIGPPGASSWLYVYPKGLQELLVYTKKNYRNPLIYITENGIDEWNDPTLSLEKSLNDTHRIDYIYQHLDYLNRAIKDGVNVKGYFSWSLLDNFEWSAGYTVRFVTSSRAINQSHFGTTCDTGVLKRSSFPAGFIFGAASAAYQYEGAANEDGRGPSIWDAFTHKYPADGSNGDVATDQYHRYKEDVQIMKEMGFDAYRFSISWTRLLPSLKPFVTIFHWDAPQALQDEYGGFVSPRIVEHFRDFADLCFREFGDKVKHWITLNEPWSYTTHGYVEGKFPPSRKSGTEPYLVAHNLLLSHAAAVKSYREKYQDKDAAQRALEFMFGWFMDPLTHGHYPHSMRSLVQNRLPKFTKEQSKMLKGSFDFLGVNYYTAYYAANAPPPNARNPNYTTDYRANLLTERNGVPIGPETPSDWLHVYPRGIRELLLYIKRKYKDPLIYITENGIDESNDPKLPLKDALVDNQRIDYYDRHFDYLHTAIFKDGVNVKGFFAWSLFDNFEWELGYTVRFGINYVDFKDGMKRYSKLSACWFKNFLKK